MLGNKKVLLCVPKNGTMTSCYIMSPSCHITSCHGMSHHLLSVGNAFSTA